MKLFLLLIIILSFTLVSFSQSLRTFDTPPITFENSKYVNKRLRAETIRRIIKPLLKETSKPIKEIIIDFCPEDSVLRRVGRGCGDKSTRAITITINGFPTPNADAAFSIYVRIEINKGDSFGKDEYKRLLPNRLGQIFEISSRTNILKDASKTTLFETFL